MDDAELLQELESAHDLYGEAPDESLLEARVVVHLDELVQIEAVEVEGHAQVVPEDEVVLDLDEALPLLRVVLLQQQQQFGLDCRLVVVLLLVLDELHRHQLLQLVVEALQHLAEGALANHLNYLEPKGNLVVGLHAVVPFVVVKSIVLNTLHLRRVNLVLLGR